jgi:hypothetical protein
MDRSLAAALKPRLVVTTDISTLTADRGEPDDTQSMVRLMLHACDLEIEGLIASSTMAKGRVVHDDYIRAIVEAYGQVRDRLAVHRSDYPTAEALFERIAPGNGEYGVAHVGAGHDTPGSDRIIAAVDRPDVRPVWVAAWGGTTDLAQALWRVSEDRSPQELGAFLARLRVYAIGDQDDTGPWIRERFPDLLYITCRQVFRGMYKDGDPSLVTREWVSRHVTAGHGPLGAAYPNYDGGDPWGRVKGVKEGDTPSFLYLLPVGLGNPEEPTWGSWGGRFTGPHPQYTDAVDTVGGVTSERATVYRWRPAYQAAFQARMAWCHTSYDEANHEPEARLAGPPRREVQPGEEVVLDASGSTDPDGDRLSFRWWVYPEPGTYRGPLTIGDAQEPVARVVAPAVERPETIHVILEVTDDGEPRLTSYRRVVVTVTP